MEIKKRYEKGLPNSFMFSLQELEENGVIKVSMLKKLLLLGKIESIKVGVKNFITKDEILRFLTENTILRTNASNN